MILRPDYIERIKKLEDLKFNNFLIKDKNIHHISNHARGNLYDNITRIDFIALYPNILIGLFNEGLLNEKWKNDINKVKWFLENRTDLKLLSPDEYGKWKIHCNSLYIKIKSPYVVEYMNIFYSEMIEKYGDLIIYIDVDRIYLKLSKEKFQAKTQIEELNDFNYYVEFINYFYAEELKKYIEQDSFGQLACSGFKEPNKTNLENLIKREIRRRKLDNLGI
jgi:REP element-mobilizing transposase RayT